MLLQLLLLLQNQSLPVACWGVSSLSSSMPKARSGSGLGGDSRKVHSGRETEAQASGLWWGRSQGNSREPLGRIVS